uniref:Aquaporin-9-like n=1 Tax=Sinocyclocheilus grahami TaxID=75366 RepID=A0A672T932_SINGR
MDTTSSGSNHGPQGQTFTHMSTSVALAEMVDRLLRRCRIKSSLFRECLAEFFGVYILILFGCGSVAQVTTSQNTKGEYLSINLGFALGTTFGIYVAKGVSGAHLNPAVSLTLCVLGRFSWTCLPFYVCSQLLGAFLAAATVALQYYGIAWLPHFTAA